MIKIIFSRYSKGSDYSTIYSSYHFSTTSDCVALAQYLQNKEMHVSIRNNIKTLENQLETIKEEFRAPLETKLNFMKKNCPNYDKPYWETLSNEEINEITQILDNTWSREFPSNYRSMAASFNKIHEILNQ